jgi:peptidyl-prolyl cis-trans isomerase C
MRLFRPQIAAIVAAALVLTLAACNQANSPNGRPAAPLTNPVVAATVNNKPIFIDDVLAEAVARGAIKEGEDLDASSPIFYQIMEDLIETRLLANEAEARGLDKGAEVKHRLEQARERILANVLNENIAATALRDSAIERMYREQVRLLKQGREVRARHILFDTKEAALAAKKRLDNGELFEALAYELSKDRSTAPDGGDLGYFLPEAMPDGLREIAQNTAVGQVGGPAQTDQGWHLLKIEERRDAAPPTFEEMRPKIVQWLMFDEQRRVVEKLKSNARIARITDQPGGGQPGGGLAARPGLPAPEAAPPEDTPAPPLATPPAAPSAAPPAAAPRQPAASGGAAPAPARRPAAGTLPDTAAAPMPPLSQPGLSLPPLPAPIPSTAPGGRDL